jgi:hypothetical protein
VKTTFSPLTSLKGVDPAGPRGLMVRVTLPTDAATFDAGMSDRTSAPKGPFGAGEGDVLGFVISGKLPLLL